MSNLRVIVLEDHPLVRQAIADQLVARGCDVVFSGVSVREALDTIEHSKIDCVVMDLDLGEGHPQITSVADVSATGVPVVIMTAFATLPTVHAALAAGARGFVSKEAEVDEFHAAIDAAVRGERYLSPDLHDDRGEHLPAPGLSEQERRAIALFASGMKMSDVSEHMGVSLHTAKEYVKRARVKYAKAGKSASTKTALYHVARQDGLLP